MQELTNIEMLILVKYGELSERFMELVLKTSDGRKPTVGSNPTLSAIFGQMSERFKVPVSKTGDGSCPSVGSNPTLSAIMTRMTTCFPRQLVIRVIFFNPNQQYCCRVQ